MKKVVGLVLGLLPISVGAQCIPAPDCASIGFTETTCEGNALKCPFDTSKLYCPPCDSSFKYACDGENVVNAVGKACNGKYVTCNCIAGATLINGECVCDISCSTIGNIYYSDGSCSSCNDSSKTAVGVVALVHNGNNFAINLTSVNMPWATQQTDNNGNVIVPKYDHIEGFVSYTNIDDALKDFDGKNNTKILADTYGENATGVAGVFCYNYEPLGLESSKGQWYLPAAGELYEILVKNGNVINAALGTIGGTTVYGSHWSSSEGWNYGAWDISTSGYYKGYWNSGLGYEVRCIILID